MSTETTAGAVVTVRRFYDLVLSGDLETASGLLDDERLVIHEPAELPYGGEFHGIAGWRACTEREMSLFAIEIVKPLEYSAVGDDVVLQTVTVRFTSRDTGRSTDMEVVELLTVRDGRLTEFDVYYKNPGAVAALLD